MAIQFLTGLNIDGNIDLNSNQLKEVRIDNIGSAPTGSLRRIYYDTSSNKLRLYNGGWVDIDTGTDGDTTYELFGVGSTNGNTFKSVYAFISGQRFKLKFSSLMIFIFSIISLPILLF